jgi:hypothetical protein
MDEVDVHLWERWIRAGGIAQVIECLPSKYEALSSNPAPPQKKKKKHEKRRMNLLR